MLNIKKVTSLISIYVYIPKLVELLGLPICIASDHLLTIHIIRNMCRSTSRLANCRQQ